jgi:hypothetical protein
MVAITYETLEHVNGSNVTENILGLFFFHFNLNQKSTAKYFPLKKSLLILRTAFHITVPNIIVIL